MSRRRLRPTPNEGRLNITLEFDSVEIGADTVQIVDKITAKSKESWTPQEIEELRLFYVAVTRARKDLVGATPLDRYIPEDVTRYL